MPFSTTDLYQTLLDAFGPQDWWPMDRSYHTKEGTDPREEIIIGAILTQNTAWTNVEKALTNLKENHALSFEALLALPEDTLRHLIQPSGYFNQKAARLRLIAAALLSNLDNFFHQDLTTARTQLLAINGIGPETADSILLYAGGLPSFVVDAYTKRLSTRLPLPSGNGSYETIKKSFEQEFLSLPPGQHVSVYQELHALIVECGKTYCRPQPQCISCPLRRGCQQALQLLPQRLRRDVRQRNQLR
jgi:endonuclease-3 related protein